MTHPRLRARHRRPALDGTGAETDQNRRLVQRIVRVFCGRNVVPSGAGLDPVPGSFDPVRLGLVPLRPRARPPRPARGRAADSQPLSTVGTRFPARMRAGGLRTRACGWPRHRRAGPTAAPRPAEPCLSLRMGGADLTHVKPPVRAPLSLRPFSSPQEITP